MGLEAEFKLYVDGHEQRPECFFGNPRHLVREKMIPRSGRSWHLPSGGALYFDTGVIEVATSVFEVEPACALRATRSLWEQIAFVRRELDACEVKRGLPLRLEGFSTHFNVSVLNGVDLGPAGMRRLAELLTYILHPPVMLLAANRLSTGIGVRPRDDRIEITADFTPDPDLMTACTALVTGIALAVARRRDLDLAAIATRTLPVIAGFAPRPHTSRKGFLARFDCFPINPFQADPNERNWRLIDGRSLSLRQIAMELARPFRRAIRDVSNEAVCRHVFAVLAGRARSLLDFPDRPADYEDVGRTIRWARREHRQLARSRYERVIHRVITRRPVQIGNATYRAERMLDWFRIAFRSVETGRRRVFLLDDLATHLF